jgi:hypothetical protein
MTPRKLAEYAVAGGFLLLVGALVFGQALGQPVADSLVSGSACQPVRTGPATGSRDDGQ